MGIGRNCMIDEFYGWIYPKSKTLEELAFAEATGIELKYRGVCRINGEFVEMDWLDNSGELDTKAPQTIFPIVNIQRIDRFRDKEHYLSNTGGTSVHVAEIDKPAKDKKHVRAPEIM